MSWVKGGGQGILEISSFGSRMGIAERLAHGRIMHWDCLGCKYWIPWYLLCLITCYFYDSPTLNLIFPKLAQTCLLQLHGLAGPDIVRQRVSARNNTIVVISVEAPRLRSICNVITARMRLSLRQITYRSRQKCGAFDLCTLHLCCSRAELYLSGLS